MEDYEILDVEDIIELHDMLIRDFGGMSGIFPDTEAKVDAILNNMFAEYFGRNPYIGLFNKAAYLLYSLTKITVFLMEIKELLLIVVKSFYTLMAMN